MSFFFYKFRIYYVTFKEFRFYLFSLQIMVTFAASMLLVGQYGQLPMHLPLDACHLYAFVCLWKQYCTLVGKGLYLRVCQFTTLPYLYIFSRPAVVCKCTWKYQSYIKCLDRSFILSMVMKATSNLYIYILSVTIITPKLTNQDRKREI